MSAKNEIDWGTTGKLRTKEKTQSEQSTGQDNNDTKHLDLTKKHTGVHASCPMNRRNQHEKIRSENAEAMSSKSFEKAA